MDKILVGTDAVSEDGFCENSDLNLKKIYFWKIIKIRILLGINKLPVNFLKCLKLL